MVTLFHRTTMMAPRISSTATLW